MKRSIKLILLGLLLSITTKAQQLERQVIASAGTSSTMGSFTLGEVIVSNQNLNVISGFQQPSFLKSVLGIEDVTNRLSVYPIPTESMITISGDFFDGMITEVSLYTVDGKRVKIVPGRSQHEITIDLINQPSGYYYLTLLNDKSHTIAKYKILKL